MVYALIAVFIGGYVIAYRSTKKREQTVEDRQAELLEKAKRLEKKAGDIDVESKIRRESDEKHRNEIERQIKEKKTELEIGHKAWKDEYNRLINESKEIHSAFDNGYIQGREWLANAYKEFIETRDSEFECAAVIKTNPAWKTAEALSELKKKRAELARKVKLLEYQVATYEEYFPVISEYRDAILDEVVDMRGGNTDGLEELEPAVSHGYLSSEEYEKLPTCEKFQLALDRYQKRNKSKVEIGRMYERYIGYLYELDGWKVCFQGALKGFEDFGSDLICTKKKSTHIVQCKCWSKSKTIREKHVMQLYGTCILYRLTKKCPSVEPVLSITTDLSDEASMVAKELNVIVRSEEMRPYPMIKCNINPASAERIYHLPFDQQYDRVMIGNQTGEFYASTIVEAEEAGFRRAFRWQGPAMGGK